MIFACPLVGDVRHGVGIDYRVWGFVDYVLYR